MKTLRFTIFLLLPAIFSCQNSELSSESTAEGELKHEVSIVVLGTIQDAGSPQIGCQKACCRGLFENPDPNRMVVSVGLIDREAKKSYLFEATPDMPRQLRLLQEHSGFVSRRIVDGIFLTHAHIGHYTGLMYLGKEAMDADSITVYAMPRMNTFLQSNGPWEQLIKRENIQLKKLKEDSTIRLTKNLSIMPFLVPHRDEYSETVGYKIIGPNKSALFVPDIDKWEKWDRDIVSEIEKVDYAFLDATFYSGTELGNRDMSQIPHPSIYESMNRFTEMAPEEKSKVYFIHFNHTNPVLDSESEETKEVLEKGYRIAKAGYEFAL